MILKFNFHHNLFLFDTSVNYDTKFYRGKKTILFLHISDKFLASYKISKSLDNMLFTT